jgi:hypothetical protein
MEGLKKKYKKIQKSIQKKKIVQNKKLYKKKK